jgi:hypothetical protein
LIDLLVADCRAGAEFRPRSILKTIDDVFSHSFARGEVLHCHDMVDDGRRRQPYHQLAARSVGPSERVAEAAA